MNKPNIVYPDADDDTAKIFSGELGLRLKKIGNFEFFNGEPTSATEFKSRICNADAIILGWRIPVDVMKSAKNLKLIVFTGIGVANFVDLDAAKQQGIIVCNTPGYADQTVAEHTIALMLSSARNISKLDATMRQGEWASGISGFNLGGKTLGIVGLGGIGGRVAGLANAFGMKVICWTLRPSRQRSEKYGVEFCDLRELFSLSDIVSLHLALNEKTVCLIGKDLLSKMKDGALLVNTARAELVDERALRAELESNRISGAFDVFHREPLLESDTIRDYQNVTMTPHTAYNTPEANYSICELATESVESFFRGQPMNVFNN